MSRIVYTKRERQLCCHNVTTVTHLKGCLRFHGVGVLDFTLRKGASLMLGKESQGLHLSQTSCTVIRQPVNIWRCEPMHETCMQKNRSSPWCHNALLLPSPWRIFMAVNVTKATPMNTKQHSGKPLPTCCEEAKTTQSECYAGLCAKGACAAHVYDDRRSCYSAGATEQAQFLQAKQPT